MNRNIAKSVLKNKNIYLKKDKKMIKELVIKFSKTSKLKDIERETQILNTGLKVYGLYNEEIKAICKIISSEKDFLKHLDNADFTIFEVQLIYVKLLSKLEFNLFTSYLEKISPFIESWAITDAFEYKRAEKDIDKMNEYIKILLNSKNPWQIRIGYLLRKMYFKTNFSIDSLILEMLKHTNHPFYYVKMIIAWLGQELFINYPDKIYLYLSDNKINKEVRKMTIRKLLDSFRVTSEQKQKIKALFNKK